MEPREADAISWHVSLKHGERLIIVVHDSPCWVTANGKVAPHVHMVHRPWQSFGYRDGGSHMWHCYTPECCEGDNEIVLTCPGSVENVISHTLAYIVRDEDRLTDWSWCALSEDVPYEGRADYETAARGQDTLLVPFAEIRAGGRDYMPAWYTTTFPRPEVEGVGLFISMGEMRKGQIYLNGHNLGRFMRCPAQSRYYIPAAWLKDENRLIIFEEYGIAPDGVRLER